MTIEDAFAMFLGSLPVNIPVLVIAGLGLYYAASLRESAPRAYRSVNWGCWLLVANALAGTAVQVASLSIQLNARIDGAPDPMVWPRIFSALGLFLNAAALAFLVRAVFLDRQPSRDSRS